MTKVCAIQKKNKISFSDNQVVLLYYRTVETLSFSLKKLNEVTFISSRLMGFLIQSSIPNFYFYNYNIYILCMHNIYLFQNIFVIDTIKETTNSTRSKHQRLRKGMPKVIPSCAIQATRHSFPSENQEYTPFIENNDNNYYYQFCNSNVFQYYEPLILL